MGTASTSGEMDRKTKQVTGEKCSKDRNAPNSSVADVTNDFMKCRFLPLLRLKNHGIAKKEENSIMKSLSFVADNFGLKGLNTRGLDYPYNIVAAHWDLQDKIKRINGDIELNIVDDTLTNSFYCATHERVNTHRTLYYIPIVPLYQMLKTRHSKKCGELLLPICAYLYQIAGVPFYGHYSQVGACYEYILEFWASQYIEDEDVDLQAMHSEERKFLIIGGVMLQKIGNPFLINNMAKLLTNIDGKNKFECKCLRLLKETYEIWKNYPNNTIFQNMLFEDDFGIDVGSPDSYISFVSDTEGLLWTELERSVNEELNNYCDVMEPEIINLFDKPSKLNFQSLDYEREILRLIKKLSCLINEIRTWKI